MHSCNLTIIGYSIQLHHRLTYESNAVNHDSVVRLYLYKFIQSEGAQIGKSYLYMSYSKLEYRTKT